MAGVNFNLELFDLSKRRKQQQALDKLESQRKQSEALRQAAFGTVEAGPPTRFGEQSISGGQLAPNPFVEQLFGSQGTSGEGIKQTLALLEQQRQADQSQTDLSQQQAQVSGLTAALQSPAIQATSEGRALANLISSGADKDQVAAFKNQLSPFTLGTGQQRFTGTGDSIAIAPKKAEDLRAEQAKLFGQATTLRKEFTGATNEFSSQNAAYGRIIASAETPTAAGDLALIFNFMKILDPGSTVREGEFATAQNAAGVPDRVSAFYNNIARGERMTIKQRADFIDRATKLFRAASGQHKKTSEEFRKLAKRQGIDPSNVVFQRQLVDPQTNTPPPPPGFK